VRNTHILESIKRNKLGQPVKLANKGHSHAVKHTRDKQGYQKTLSEQGALTSYQAQMEKSECQRKPNEQGVTHKLPSAVK